MSGYQESELERVSKQFQIYGQILHAETCKIGHINETYTATYEQGGCRVRYIHQKINRSVFLDPPVVMENLLRVTQHLRQRLEAEEVSELTRRCLTIIPTRDGQPYYRDPAGEYWRTFVFIEGVTTYEAAHTPAQAYQAGHAFGEFQRLLADLPGEQLHETIPDFHNTRKRFDALVQAVTADASNRAADAKAEIDWVFRHEDIVDVLLKAHKKGKLPARVTHNDTKFNNVMLDVVTGKAMCVVDLDTVMPGLSLYDFGDMVRTTTSPTLEDERDLKKVRMHLPMFEELVRGYLSSAGRFLNRSERSLLAFSGKLITFTIGLRFLTDFLSGDVYFRVNRPGHNLDRCRTQFRLVDSIEKQEEEMQRMVNSVEVPAKLRTGARAGSRPKAPRSPARVARRRR